MASRSKEARRKAAVALGRERRKARDGAALSTGILTNPAASQNNELDSIAAIRPSRFPRPSRAHVVAASMLAVLTSAVYGSISWHMIIGQSDSAAHVSFAQHLNDTGHNLAPHFLFQALVVAVFHATPLRSFQVAGLVVVLVFYALTAVLIYFLLFKIVHDRSPLGRAPVLFTIALATILVEPLEWTGAYGIGWFWPTTYDNPTSTVSKPFSLIAFVFSAWCLSHRGKLGLWLSGIFAIATAAAVLSKPSFIICILPAAGLIALIRLIRGRNLSLGLLIAGLFIPAAAVLGWQYYETYAGTAGSVEYRDRIIWAPLVVMRYHSTHLFSKLLASIAFPLLVAALYWKRARRDLPLILAWLSFLFGLLYSYALAEKVRTFAGNFLWSGYAAIFVLFVASVMFWLGKLAVKPATVWGWTRNCLCAGAFLLHAASGAVITWRWYQSP
jgi:hypothetical protein